MLHMLLGVASAAGAAGIQPEPVEVRYTNCGGLVESIITGSALLVAFGALFVALREHRVFMRELRARAKFRLTLNVANHPDGVVETEASSVVVRVQIGLKNEGDRAATVTVLNVVAPRYVEAFRWSAPGGEELTDVKPPAPTDEKLTDVSGHEHPAQFLALELPRVSRRPHYVRWVSFMVHVPTESETSIPLRVTAQADELPDDVDEVSEGLMVRVVRASA